MAYLPFLVGFLAAGSMMLCLMRLWAVGDPDGWRYTFLPIENQLIPRPQPTARRAGTRDGRLHGDPGFPQILAGHRWSASSRGVPRCVG